MIVKIINEIMQSDENPDNSNDVTEAVVHAPTLTVSCNKTLSAASTLLCWAEDRGVRMENILMLKILKIKIYLNLSKQKPKTLLMII